MTVTKMPKKYTLVIERDEEGWLVSEVVELPGCHTQAKSMDELIKRTREAIEAYLEGDDHAVSFERFVGIQQIEV